MDYFFGRVFAKQDSVIPAGKIKKLKINSTCKMAAKHAAKFFSLVTHGSLWKWEETVGDPPSSISGSVIELEARVLNEHTAETAPRRCAGRLG